MKSIALTLLVTLLGGCATTPDGVRKSIVVGLHAITATGAIVDEVDKGKIDAAKKKAQAGDVSGALKDLDDWDAQYKKIMTSLQVLWDAMKTAADGVAAYEAGISPKLDLGALAAGVMVALADVAKALTDAGVKVPF